MVTTETGATPRPQTAGRRSVPPIVLWAGFGILMCALFAYTYIHWGLSSDARPNTYGRETIPPFYAAAVRVSEVVFTSAFLACNYFFIYRPWRRDGELSREGLLIFSCGTMWWLDLGFNYTSYYAQLNTYFVNLGNPSAHAPGWIAPNQGRAPEALFAWAVAYASWFMVVPILIGTFVLRRMSGRFPRMSRFEQALMIYGFFVVFDFALENAMVRLHLYALGGAVRALSFFPGTVEQFPIYQSLTVGLLWAGLSMLWFHRDDHGYTIIERGVHKLTIKGRPVGRKTKKLLSFFALAGFVNAAMIVCIEIPVNAIQLHADPIPADMPPYLLAGLCGPDMAIACPAPGLPIATVNAPTNRTITPDELAKFNAPTP